MVSVLNYHKKNPHLAVGGANATDSLTVNKESHHPQQNIYSHDDKTLLLQTVTTVNIVPSKKLRFALHFTTAATVGMVL